MEFEAYMKIDSDPTELTEDEKVKVTSCNSFFFKYKLYGLGTVLLIKHCLLK
jgi:hypothetical protein